MESEQESPTYPGGASTVSSFNSVVSFVPFRARPLSLAATTTTTTAASTSSNVTTSITTVTQPRPLSCGSVTSSASARTLVKPRPWRFLQKIRMGNSLTREKAEGEDYTLEGDSDREEEENSDDDDDDDDDDDNDDDEGQMIDKESSVDPSNSTPANSGYWKEPAREILRPNGDHNVILPLDTPKPDAGSKPAMDSSPVEAVSKPADRRVTENDNEVDRRHPRAFEPEVKTPKSIFSEGRRAKLPVEQKVVKFTDLELPQRPKSEGSPDKKLVLNAQENAVKISFAKPITIQSPTAGTPPSATPTEEGVTPRTKHLLTRSKSDPMETPKKEPVGSTASPVEDVLFSLGYCRVEVVEVPRSSLDPKPEKKPDKTNADTPSDKTSTVSTPGKPITDTAPGRITIDKVEVEEVPRSSLHKQIDEKPEKTKPPEVTNTDTTPPKTSTRPAPSKTSHYAFPEKPISTVDTTMDTKGKPADKPHEKEPSGVEKKPSKKVTIEVSPEEKPKEHVKMFPWKVEFSTKAKPASGDEAEESWPAKEKSVEKSPAEGKSTDSSLKSVSKSKGEKEPAAQPKKHRGLLTFMRDKTDKHKHEATTKKADKVDGAKSPQDKKAVSPEQSQPQPKQEAHPLLRQPVQDEPQKQPQEEQAQPEKQQPQHQQPQQQQEQQQQQPPQQFQSPIPPPKPPHLEDFSSSDTQNSDIDSLYGSMRRNQARLVQGQISESDGETTPQGTARRLPPRRHTVGGAQIQQHLMEGDDTERKREAFFELLAQRYPQYADKITGMAVQQANTAAERNPRPREPQRRRTTAVVYSPHGRALDYEDMGTMSDVELSSFQRGGYGRASLPIVRSASSSLERPLGLVFLVYRDETKKALLPNEITTLDTVRALFVRAFPEKLTMEFLDSPRRKIYILEAATNIFFQLEDLRDIKDRTVLKIHECDSTEPQKVRTHPEVRGRTVQQPSSRPASRQGFTGETLYGEIGKTQSLPVSSAQSYQELMQKERMQWEMEQNYLQAQSRHSRSRSLTPEPAGAERPRSLSTGAPRTRFSHSPDRLPTPDRAPHLNPIPENPRLLANGFREAMVNGGGGHYDSLPGHQSHHHTVASPTSHHPPGQPGRVLSPPPVGGPIYESVYAAYAHPQSYVSHSMRAAPPSGPQRATGPSADMRGSRRDVAPTNRHSLTFAAMTGNVAPLYESYPQRSQSYRVTPERDVLPPRPQSATPHDPETRNRMERMEAQIASLAAWVHQCQPSPAEPPRRGPGSSRSLSDIPTAYSLRQPVVTMEMREKMADVQQRLKELRKEMQSLRRMEQLNQEAIRDAFSETLVKIKRVMSSAPGAENQVLRHQRMEVNSLVQAYLEDKECVEKELSDLEASIEELREDVVARKCRVNVSDVEGFALLLSNITKSLADLKGRFPKIHRSLKGVMAGEMEVVVKEEKFIKEEPSKLEAALKRCKQLTSTLYILKRLASVQDNRPLQVPFMATESKDVGDGEKMAILESIRAMVPDHETRVQSLEAADASRERKKKIVTQQESLKFTKSLQTASKSLKPMTQSEAGTGKTDTVPKGDSDSKHGVDTDRVKSPPPEIPAKPARLLSSSEMKKSGVGRTESSRSDKSDRGVSSSSLPMHRVTVTSQVSDDDEEAAKYAEQLANQRSAARTAFFSSLTSPGTSPTISQPETSKPSASSDKVLTTTAQTGVSSSASSSLSTTSSFSKPSSGVFYQAISPTRLRSAFSSIPLPNKSSYAISPDASKDKDDGDSFKPKKVPPPPPPRKSSARLPYGYAGGSASAVNGGSSGSGSSRRDSDKSSDAHGKKDAGLMVHKPSSPTSPSGGITGPLSSTPKPATPQKPMNKFQKDIAQGIYANMNRPDLQNQKVAPESIITSMASPPPAAVTTNSQDPQYVDDQDWSGSESTGSTTSLDSQQGVALLRSNSAAADSLAGCRLKPEPPQRHSSLMAKGSGIGSVEESHKSKTQMLLERNKKVQDNGSKSTQMNGLNGARDGHKT